MERFRLFHKDMGLFQVYIDLEILIQGSVKLEVTTFVHRTFNMSFINSPFITVIHSIKNSVRRKYE
jgi:hypothetical protein